jgi:sporulation protein YlmC with PRC-barrel domain
MRLSDLTGHPVISTDDAKELGRLDNVVIDPRSSTVQSYRLSGGKWVLPADATTSVGGDAVMVEAGDCIREPQSEIERRAVDRDLQVIGARVLSDHGNELGTVTDLEYDVRTGHIESIAVGSTHIPGDDLIGVGTYAIVVRDPYENENETGQRR